MTPSTCARLAVLSLLLLATPLRASEFRVVTPKGSIAFAIDDDWPVVAMQTAPPISTAAFQIPNPADSESPDATNLALSFFRIDSDKAREALTNLKKNFGVEQPKGIAPTGWTTYRADGKQGATHYTVVDGIREFGSVIVAVRLAWPHLAKNPADYDAQMEKTFRNLLASIVATPGAYTASIGDVIWRTGKP